MANVCLGKEALSGLCTKIGVSGFWLLGGQQCVLLVHV